MRIGEREIPRINYGQLNARQQERYNFQKAGAILADYGFAVMKLDDDWNGADFIAPHVSGSLTLMVQLKGRLAFGNKYLNKGIHVMFKGALGWYLIPHDEALERVLRVKNFRNTRSWRIRGGYSIKKPTAAVLNVLNDYLI